MKNYEFSCNEKRKGYGFSQNNNKRQVMASHKTKVGRLRILT